MRFLSSIFCYSFFSSFGHFVHGHIVADYLSRITSRATNRTCKHKFIAHFFCIFIKFMTITLRLSKNFITNMYFYSGALIYFMVFIEKKIRFMVCFTTTVSNITFKIFFPVKYVSRHYLQIDKILCKFGICID